MAKDTAWLNLLHYKTSISGSWQSQADDARFFLSADGVHSAEAELTANIRGFMRDELSSKAKNGQAVHPQCQFPARLFWLKSKPGFAEVFPQIKCNAFNEWREKLGASQVTLLFPSMHLDNPASMFGHTFIRFDENRKNPLLSKTLSYAAAVDKYDSALVYAWKGIMGGYNGQFYIKPYYETVQEYSDIEQRDIWEYQLNLNKGEVDQLVRHLWEVRGIKFDYYFLRENCAFRLLALLDVAREGINLSLQSHPVYAVPVDTVRDVERAGLIEQRIYRPATHNKITQMYKQLPENNRETALDITLGELTVNDVKLNFSEKEQAEIYLLADEIIAQRKNLTKKYQDLQISILSARSKLSVGSEDVKFNFKSSSPEMSHLSARWQFSAGEYEGQEFYEIGLRPVFHDLLDSGEGFINGSGISILDGQVRWYKDSQKLKLQTLNLFSLRSIVPVKPWVKPLSRQVSMQIKKREINALEQITEFEAQFDMGYAVQMSEAIVYLMAKAEIDYATELEDNHGFYLGAESGVLWGFNYPFLTGQSEIKYQNLQHVSGELGDIQRASIGVQINILKDHALRFEYNHIEYETFTIEQGRLSYLLYF